MSLSSASKQGYAKYQVKCPGDIGMTRFKCTGFAALLLGVLLSTGPFTLTAGAAKNEKEKIVQAQMVLTVSESKRLIAKAVAQMPLVKKALKNGIVIITKGTTTTYVAEEILGKKIEPGAFLYGRVCPAKSNTKLNFSKTIKEVVLIKGKVRDDLSLSEAVKLLGSNDVVIKGANALDYENKTAGGLVGAASSGTVGTIMPYVVGAKAQLVIPVGLEKQVSDKVVDITKKMSQPVESLNNIPSMFLFTGHIVTEIEALKILTDVSAFQAAAGGIAGAEGSVRIVCRGPKKQVIKALDLADEIQGEPPFVDNHSGGTK